MSPSPSTIRTQPAPATSSLPSASATTISPYPSTPAPACTPTAATFTPSSTMTPTMATTVPVATPATTAAAAAATSTTTTATTLSPTTLSPTTLSPTALSPSKTATTTTTATPSSATTTTTATPSMATTMVSSSTASSSTSISSPHAQHMPQQPHTTNTNTNATPAPNPHSATTHSLPPPLAAASSPPPSPIDDTIARQVEWYLSRHNLPTDAFLKQHMDKDYWVPLELILTFPRMKALGAKDPARVAALLHARAPDIEVDAGAARIRPAWALRSHLILRDVTVDATQADMAVLLRIPFAAPVTGPAVSSSTPTVSHSPSATNVSSPSTKASSIDSKSTTVANTSSTSATTAQNQPQSQPQPQSQTLHQESQPSQPHTHPPLSSPQTPHLPGLICILQMTENVWIASFDNPTGAADALSSIDGQSVRGQRISASVYREGLEPQTIPYAPTVYQAIPNPYATATPPPPSPMSSHGTESVRPYPTDGSAGPMYSYPYVQYPISSPDQQHGSSAMFLPHNHPHHLHARSSTHLQMHDPNLVPASPRRSTHSSSNDSRGGGGGGGGQHPRSNGQRVNGHRRSQHHHSNGRSHGNGNSENSNGNRNGGNANLAGNGGGPGNGVGSINSTNNNISSNNSINNTSNNAKFDNNDNNLNLNSNNNINSTSSDSQNRTAENSHSPTHGQNSRRRARVPRRQNSRQLSPEEQANAGDASASASEDAPQPEPEPAPDVSSMYFPPLRSPTPQKDGPVSSSSAATSQDSDGCKGLNMPGSAIASPALGVGNRLTMDASARRRDVSANGVPSTNKVTTGSDRPSRSVPTSPRMTAADKAKSVGAVNMGSQTPHAGQTGRLHTGKVSSVTASANSATVAVAASLQKGGSMNGGGAKSISYAAMVLRSSQSVGTTGTNVGGTGTGGHGSGNTINGGGSGQQAPDNKTEKNSHKGKGDGGAGDATSSSSAAGGLKGKRQARSPVGVWAAKPASVVKAAPDMSTGMNNGTANGAAGGIVSGMMGNGLMGNGAMGNGTMGNGAITNGAMANGTMANGAMSNGAMSNGTMASGNGKAGRGGGWSVVNGGGAGGGRKGLAGGKGGLRSQVEVDGASGQQAGVDMNGIMRAVKSHAIGKADDGESA